MLLVLSMELECVMSQLNVDTIGSQTGTTISVASGHTYKMQMEKLLLEIKYLT